jgi:hypothetical protein
MMSPGPSRLLMQLVQVVQKSVPLATAMAPGSFWPVASVMAVPVPPSLLPPDPEQPEESAASPS